jgi:biopolymer transport protein ExbD
MQLVSPPRRRRRLIDLTPLIDVVFILLLFFMLASRFHQWRALTVSASGTPGDRDAVPAVLVRVHGDGSLDLNTEAIPSPALTARLRLALTREPGLAVQIESADEVPLQTLVTVLDQVHAAGISRIHLR